MTIKNISKDKSCDRRFVETCRQAIISILAKKVSPERIKANFFKAPST